MTLLLLHAASTWFLVGLSWVVQVVVYPSFRLLGPMWTSFHDAHSRRLAAAIGVPWMVQGVTVALLLLQGSGAWGLRLLAGLLALAPVVLTVLFAVPLHRRLVSYDAAQVSSLLRVHALRTVAWSLGGVVSLLLIVAT